MNSRPWPCSGRSARQPRKPGHGATGSGHSIRLSAAGAPWWELARASSVEAAQASSWTKPGGSYSKWNDGISSRSGAASNPRQPAAESQGLRTMRPMPASGW